MLYVNAGKRLRTPGQGQETKTGADTNAMTNTDPDTERWYRPPSSYQIGRLRSKLRDKNRGRGRGRSVVAAAPFSDFTQLLYVAVPNLGGLNVEV